MRGVDNLPSEEGWEKFATGIESDADCARELRFGRRDSGGRLEKTETRFVRVGFGLAALGLSCLQACGPAEVHVTTQRYDNARTGQNRSERLLTVANVNAARFGKLFARAVDDEVYAQPLYVSNLEVPGRGPHNVLFVATVSNAIYAFDADDPAAAEPLWTVNLTPAAPGARPVQAGDVGHNCIPYRDFADRIGIAGTPVIDADSGTLYVVARTKEGDAFVQRLHALDIATGAPRPNSPVVIAATAEGTGQGSVNGKLRFDPEIHNQRAALLLANGTVHIAWGAHCDTGPYHGWIMGYDAATLAQRFTTVVTPDGGGGVWQSNSGPSADEEGNIYVSVGNGTATAPNGGRDYGSAYLKLDTGGAILDWFIPHNFAWLNEADFDVGTTGVLVVPDTNLLIGGSKEPALFVLDRNRLGHYRKDSNGQILQTVAEAVLGGLHGTPTYWDGPLGPHVYVWGNYDVGKMFRLRDGRIEPSPTSQTKAMSEMPGGSLVISADGAKAGSGILWALTADGNANHQSVPGTLRAYDATDLSRELWTSRQNAARDDLGFLAKFNTPVVAGGKVYVPTFSKTIAVYGLLPEAK